MKEFLLQYQWMCLKAKSENGEFPIINIRPMYEENSVGGREPLTSVSCFSHGSELLINGQFEVYLNRYYLETSAGNGSDIVYWTGFIVHEMLHKLGHNHHDEDYSNRWQINVKK
jgi:hypothetical protein